MALGRAKALIKRAGQVAMHSLPLPEETRDQLAFELRGVLGRARNPLRAWAPEGPGPHYLNVGSGGINQAHAIALDYFGNGAQLEAGLRHPLPIGSACVDGVFSEHTLEHLTYAHAKRLLTELRRILRPGGTIRIIVPDVGLFCVKYANADRAWFDQWASVTLAPRQRALTSPVEAISFVTQEYGHRSCWDAALLGHALSGAGFVDVTVCKAGQGRVAALVLDRVIPARTLVSLYMEGRVPA